MVGDPVIHGTVPYMAPEEFDRNASSDARLVDVWALGVITYELLAGRRPFEGASTDAVRHAILHRAPSPLSGRVPHLPGGSRRASSCVRCRNDPKTVKPPSRSSEANFSRPRGASAFAACAAPPSPRVSRFSWRCLHGGGIAPYRRRFPSRRSRASTECP
jgi:serine/threonine protein kinase